LNELSIFYLSLLASLISIGRVFFTILLSIVTGFLLTYLVMKNKVLENIYVSLIGIFESIPVISFFPLALLFFVNFIGGELGVEIAVLFLIFTATVWNIWTGIYQAFKTIPIHFIETSENYRLSFSLKFLYLYIPFSMPRIASQIIPSFTNGIFYLTVSEVFTLGNSTFSVFGIGSLIANLIANGDYIQALISLLVLTLVIIPILYALRFFANWSVEKFGIDTEIKYYKRGKLRIRYSIRIYKSLSSISKVSRYIVEKINILPRRRLSEEESVEVKTKTNRYKIVKYVFSFTFLLIVFYLILLEISQINMITWYTLLQSTPSILYDMLIDYIRVFIISLIALVISLFLAYYLVTHPRLEKIFIPLIQALSAIPAPSYFPFIFLLTYNAFHNIFGGYVNEVYVIILGFISCFYYVFYTYWAGIKSIPYEVWEVMNNFQLSLWSKLRYIIIPSALPYLVSGLSSTINGAWGGLAIGEYWPGIYQGQDLEVNHGIMKLLAISAANGDLALVAWASFILGIAVLLFSIFFTRRIMDVARQKYLVEETIFIA